MNASSSFVSRHGRFVARVGLAATLVAAAALAGCAGQDVQVTVTVPAAASPEPSAVPSAANPGDPASADPGDPAEPAPAPPATTAPPAPDTGAASVVVTRGPVAPECTHTVCYIVHVTWKNLDPGPHDTQCVTDHGDLATWSQSTYNYPTADGERDLGCFLGYPGSHVWVVLDGTLESARVVW